jgi:hypothetical protein
MAAEIPATAEVTLKSDASKQFLDTLSPGNREVHCSRSKMAPTGCKVKNCAITRKL